MEDVCFSKYMKYHHNFLDIRGIYCYKQVENLKLVFFLSKNEVICLLFYWKIKIAVFFYASNYISRRNGKKAGRIDTE